MLCDGHGSVRQVTDYLGAVTSNLGYDCYGKARNLDPAPVAVSLLYGGGMWDNNAQQ
jgi:hypothetical protein